MIVKPWEYEHRLAELEENYGKGLCDKRAAVAIRYVDPDGYPLPKQRGRCEMLVRKGLRPKPILGPTQGPRFRPEHTTISIEDKDGAVLWSNNGPAVEVLED